ncbi:RpiB/LacA/LacB family sugar-phosphate isomerase [Candidatus Saccharibacteria bacterium]|nr:RpiB/LacA/LacB family sugar-phosphate isomerase [Candidatus Saccharibacteria bacterium]
MKIALSTDHAGFERLKKLKRGLELAGYATHDFGPAQFDLNDDYPDYVKPACEAILAGGCEVGIIFGGSGQGEAMAANRFNGIRCTVWYGPSVPIEAVNAEGMLSNDPYEILKLSKEHNNANMLSIAGRFVSDDETLKVAIMWLNHKFKTEERHQRRIEKLDRLS